MVEEGIQQQQYTMENPEALWTITEACRHHQHSISELQMQCIFLGGGRFITINRQRIIQIMYIRAEMKDIRNIH